MCRELVTEVTLRHTPDYPDGLLLPLRLRGRRNARDRPLHGQWACCGSAAIGFAISGPDVATVFLIEAIESIAPDAVLLSSSVEDELSRLPRRSPGDSGSVARQEIAAHPGWR